jgi:hypothetical protein
VRARAHTPVDHKNIPHDVQIHSFVNGFDVFGRLRKRCLGLLNLCEISALFNFFAAAAAAAAKAAVDPCFLVLLGPDITQSTLTSPRSEINLSAMALCCMLLPSAVPISKSPVRGYPRTFRGFPESRPSLVNRL